MKRLPIVFCLDVSPSMGWKEGQNSSSIELLNESVNNFIKALKENEKASSAAEIAFVTFSTNIVMDTDFKQLKEIDHVTLKPVEHGGTRMGQAVLHSIDKINKQREKLTDKFIDYYAPFLVLVTDGNPDKNDDIQKEKEAIERVKSYCSSHVGAFEIIVPFIVGVGNRVDSKTLMSYSEGFINGFFHIKDGNKKSKGFGEVFKLIGNSVTKSIDLNNTEKAIEEIKNIMKKDSLKDVLDIIGSI